VKAVAIKTKQVKTKQMPRVLLAAQKAVKGNASANWGKGPGEPYPWRKK